MPESIPWTRNVPVRYESDVAVIGGGMAGVGAAVAAAAQGARVVLVERFAVTGGMMTSGGVANWCGEQKGAGDVFTQVQEGLAAFDALGPVRIDKHGATTQVFDHEILALVLQELLLRRGVKLLLHTRFVDARVRHGAITEAVVCGSSGPEALRAKAFIDCTGEACLARAAGCETMLGCEGSSLPIPMSMMWFLREMGEPVPPQVPEGWFTPVRDAKDLPMVSFWPNGPGGKAVKVKVAGFDASDTESMTAAEIRGRRRMMEILDYYQRVEGKPWRYDRCSPIIGIREGRRVVGDYVLTVDDVRAGARFDDAVARGSWWLDAIRPDNDKREYSLPEDQLAVAPYQIPYRSLLARDARNLLMAGRCLSCDQLALSSARVATTCCMMGQAAGTAAAMAAKAGVAPRDLDVRELQGVLKDKGVRTDL